jgi:hypothetical protein
MSLTAWCSAVAAQSAVASTSAATFSGTGYLSVQ